MKTATTCYEVPCDRSVPGRPRYFPRQIITPDDLNLGLEYTRSKLRWHNRMMHGWGVVCGTEVCLVPSADATPNKFEPWKVRIKPGYILGPYGDEIIIDCGRTIDLRSRGVTGITGEPCVDAVDPWCAEVIQEPESGSFYIAVRYKEVPARPVRVQPVGCGCDDSACESSRLVDGYEIAILDHCPDSHQKPPNLDEIVGQQIPACSTCPTEPWVVLAKAEPDADGNIKLDNCICRRLAISFADFWWQCKHEPGVSPVKVTSLDPKDLVAGKTMLGVEIMGENLDLAVSASFGEGITVAKFIAGDSKRRAALVNVDLHAKNGPRDVVFTDKDHKTLTLKGAVTVQGGDTAAPKPALPVESIPTTGGASAKPAKPAAKKPSAAKRRGKTTR